MVLFIVSVALLIWFAENRSERIYNRYYLSCIIELKQLQTYREDIKDPASACKRLAYTEARTARIVVMASGFVLTIPFLSWAFTKESDHGKEVT